MKRIFTLSALFMTVVVLLASCVKRSDQYFDESYWLSKERGVVVYSSGACSYYVVETFRGYTVIRSGDGYMPFEGDILYGNFSNTGSRDIYNYSDRSLMRGNIIEYWLDYFDAQDAIDYYCGYYGVNGTDKTLSKDSGSSSKKMIMKADKNVLNAKP
ncbi:hypothetical protein ACFS6H_08270 [Terrimonas rubra]|uniref:DKNYY family protein n=1 Tax=Terrimonas rubra TaxID=1035890 RepID=A0ABW6A525_9BACT